ncbi:MAG: rhodanese-like domain-containing protein [Persephonella sp.]|nr:rhodanese-like domain-containing protein [Persephonella sp.]
MKRLLFAVILLFFSCRGMAFTDVSAEEFKKLMNKNNVIILDVRTPQEYEKDGHIKGQILSPVQLFRYTLYLPGLRDKNSFSLL